jgi:hypothetical protein
MYTPEAGTLFLSNSLLLILTTSGIIIILQTFKHYLTQLNWRFAEKLITDSMEVLWWKIDEI